LHLAVRISNPGTIKILIDNGADIRVRNCKQQTPLALAVILNTAHMLQELLGGNDSDLLSTATSSATTAITSSLSSSTSSCSSNSSSSGSTSDSAPSTEPSKPKKKRRETSGLLNTDKRKERRKARHSSFNFDVTSAMLPPISPRSLDDSASAPQIDSGASLLQKPKKSKSVEHKKKRKRSNIGSKSAEAVVRLVVHAPDASDADSRACQDKADEGVISNTASKGASEGSDDELKTFVFPDVGRLLDRDLM
jgi:ankyrin repeat protein